LATSAFAAVRALKRVDLPTLGRPTIPSRSMDESYRVVVRRLIGGLLNG
jgi:hypothetical protein